MTINIILLLLLFDDITNFTLSKKIGSGFIHPFDKLMSFSYFSHLILLKISFFNVKEIDLSYKH